MEIELSTGLLSFSAEDPGGWERVLSTAHVLDAAGFDRLVVSDHVVFGERLEEYGRPELGGQRGGRQPTGPDGHWLEPLTTLAVVAGRTGRIRLGTNILIAALRRPVVLAKETATLDALSGGRLDLGVGVGWQREEYEAAGLDFDGRGRLLDHTLEVCRTLWTETRASYSSPELSFDAIHMMPKPAQRGGVPVWVSGTVNPRVVARLARNGCRWIPWGDAAADLRTGVAQMREQLAAVDGDAESLRVVGNLPTVLGDDGSIAVDRTIDGVPALVEAGATDLRVRVGLPEEPRAQLERWRELVAAFRAAVGRAPLDG